MQHFDPALYAKLEKALQDPFVRVGTIHKVENATIHGMPGVKIILSWMEPQENDEDCPNVHALELLIPAALMGEVRAQLKALLALQTRPPAKNRSRDSRKRPGR